MTHIHEACLPDTSLANQQIHRPHSHALLLIQGLNTDQDLLEQALEKGTDILAHADGFRLVIVVDLFAHVGQFIDQLANLLVRCLGTLLLGRGRVRVVTGLGTVHLLEVDLPTLECLLERREYDIVEGV